MQMSKPESDLADRAAVLARLSTALSLMQEQVSLLKAMIGSASSISKRARAADVSVQLRGYFVEMDAIHAYAEATFRDVSMLQQDEVQAIARRAGWLK